ncbi:MAG: glutathione S-transferase family protein [Geminicoccaceae bacterium]
MSAPVLLGRFLSPYVRRVAVTLNHFGMAFERNVISAIGDEEERERANPVGRVPALILASGETLIDSAAILDYLDELAGPDRAIVPPDGEPRRAALRQIALATGAIDRAMAANAERRRPETQHDPQRQERLLRQAGQGFDALERDLDGSTWFDGTELGQADITAAIGFTFVNHIFPQTLEAATLPSLAALTERCEMLSAFKNASID